MPTSGSSEFNLTGKQLVKSAMRGLGIIQSGEAPSHEEMQDGMEALELMIKSLQGLGYHLWTYSDATLFSESGERAYSFPGSRAVSPFSETTTAADASQGDNSLSVSKAVMSVDNVIGIEIGDTIEWTTVTSVSGTDIGIDDALSADVDSGATVYSYDPENVIGRPLRIQSVHRGDSDTPLIEMSRSDYFEQPNKDTKSIPTQFYYDPGRAEGTLYLWPATKVAQPFTMTYTRPIEDFDKTSNNPDLPQEWLETLKYQLMIRLAPEYGVTMRQDVAALGQSLLENMMAWDTEPVSVYFEPDLRC